MRKQITQKIWSDARKTFLVINFSTRDLVRVTWEIWISFCFDVRQSRPRHLAQYTAGIKL